MIYRNLHLVTKKFSSFCKKPIDKSKKALSLHRDDMRTSYTT